MADITDTTFQSDVVDRSKEVPVVVDLWAPWCAPCRDLGPLLEQAVAATDGKVELAKVDIDANPEVARAFNVQSIPAVFALKDGKVVDSFIGGKPERAVNEFIAGLLPTDEQMKVAAFLEAGDETSLRAALELAPADETVITALADVLATDGRGAEALELLAKIPETPDTRRIAALARTGGAPADDIEQRLEVLLDRVKDDDGSRTEFVDLLELLPDNDRRGVWRRKLSARLF